MEIADLKNYGKPLSDISATFDGALEKKINQIGYRILKDQLGFWGMIRHTLATVTEKRRMAAMDLGSLRDRGLSNEKFIKSQIEFAAIYSAMKNMVGRDKTLEVMNMLMAEVARVAYPVIFPSTDDLKETGDPWTAWKAYFCAMAEADNHAGCHVYEVIEDGEDAFQMNCTYCAWYEIPKVLGVPEACLPSCYADDVFFPNACREIGVEFKRTTTLAKGGDVCDFRFEVIDG